MLINGHNLFVILLITFAVSFICTPIVKLISIKINAVDIPNSSRKIHKKIMPRSGGLAIFFSFLVGYMLFAPMTTQMLSVLIGSFVIILLGLIDDINPLRAIYQLIGQLIAASIVVFYGNITISMVNIFGLSIDLGIFAYPITLIFIVGIINAINFTDGLDGLAAGTSTIYFISIAILGYIMNQLGGLDVILCTIMIGACLGFLPYNFSPASIFMGDVGSNFLGFIISIIALLGFKTATVASLIVPLLLLFVPIFDTVLAMCRRILKGKSVGESDGEHLHYQFLKSTKSQTKSVLIMYLINSLFSLVSIFYTLGNKKISIILYMLLLLFFVFIIFKTNILYEHKKKGTK